MGTLIIWAALLYSASAQTVVPQAEVVSQAPPSPLFVEIAATDARPCVRLYRNGGSAGCSSPRGGSIAVLLPVGSTAEIAQFAAADVRAHAVVPSSFFSNTTLGALDATGNLAGVLVLPWRLASGAYAVPEKGYAPARASSWNPAGEDLLQRDLGYPIFEIASLAVAEDLAMRADANVAKISATGLSYPRNVARLNTFMGPEAMDTQRCLEMGNCMPIGGMSAWASKGALDGDVKPILLATAKMDSTSMFHDTARGADDAISGLVALLASAAALAPIEPAQLPAARIVFAAFQGESYGSIGSRKFIADVRNFTCATHLSAEDSPIGKRMCLSPFTVDAAFEGVSLKNIAQIVAVHMVGGGAARVGGHSLKVHRATSTASATLAGVATAAGAAAASSGPGDLPPTPASTFVAALPDAAAVVISRYDASFGEGSAATSAGSWPCVACSERTRSADGGAATLRASLGAHATPLPSPPPRLAPPLSAPHSLRLRFALRTSPFFARSMHVPRALHRRYRSRYDVADLTIDAAQVVEATQVLTQTLCRAAGGATGVCASAVANVSSALVQELLDCYLVGSAFNCGLAARYTGRSAAQLDAGELSAYTSVYVQPYIARLAELSANMKVRSPTVVARSLTLTLTCASFLLFLLRGVASARASAPLRSHLCSSAPLLLRFSPPLDRFCSGSNGSLHTSPHPSHTLTSSRTMPTLTRCTSAQSRRKSSLSSSLRARRRSAETRRATWRAAPAVPRPPSASTGHALHRPPTSTLP